MVDEASRQGAQILPGVENGRDQCSPLRAGDSPVSYSLQWFKSDDCEASSTRTDIGTRDQMVPLISYRPRCHLWSTPIEPRMTSVLSKCLYY